MFLPSVKQLSRDNFSRTKLIASSTTRVKELLLAEPRMVISSCGARDKLVQQAQLQVMNGKHNHHLNA
jgi:hypothetical protein